MTRHLAALACAALAAACGGGGPEARAGAPDCGGCHDLAELSSPGFGAGLSPGEWMAESGRGLQMGNSLLPGDQSYGAAWVDRGGHDEADLQDCAVCHVVDADGGGHGSARFPKGATGAPEGCDGCHGWLSPGLRPRDLLDNADSGHAAIMRDGFRSEGPGGAYLSVTRLRPGCVGCHALRSDRHGEVPGCTDCHGFGGPAESGSPHERHLAIIEAGRAANAPEHEGASPCAWCHGFDPDAGGPFRASCHGCHLSGHDPSPSGWP